MATPEKGKTCEALGDLVGALIELGALVDEACGVCGRRDDEASLVLCDGCEAGAAHTYCLGLDGVPAGDWFCAACASQRGSTGTRKTSVSV